MIESPKATLAKLLSVTIVFWSCFVLSFKLAILVGGDKPFESVYLKATRGPSLHGGFNPI
jgi:hypothetical protein